MSRTCCLAGVADDKIAMLCGVLRTAGAPALSSISALNVAELGKMTPELMLCDIDGLEVDPLEMLRRLRFVLPGCIIAVYTGVTTQSWALSCHLAGANCLLSKDSTGAQLAAGVRSALRSGCFTDPRFAAA